LAGKKIKLVQWLGIVVGGTTQRVRGNSVHAPFGSVLSESSCPMPFDIRFRFAFLV